MNTKDKTVECEFNPILTAFLFMLDGIHRVEGGELMITSGSEATGHAYTSLHHSIPCCAADVRNWDRVGWDGVQQYEDTMHLATVFCQKHPQLAVGDIDVVLEKDHIHIELQPKRRG